MMSSLVTCTGSRTWETNASRNWSRSVVPRFTRNESAGWSSTGAAFVSIIPDGHGGHFMNRASESTGEDRNVSVFVVGGNVVAHFSGADSGGGKLWSWYVVHGVIGGVVWFEHGTFAESVCWDAGWGSQTANKTNSMQFIHNATRSLSVVQSPFQVINLPLPHFRFKNSWSYNILKHLTNQFWTASQSVNDVVSSVFSLQSCSGMRELLILEKRSVRKTGHRSTGGEHGGNTWASFVS